MAGRRDVLLNVNRQSLEPAVGHVEHRQADHEGEDEPQCDGNFIHDYAPGRARQGCPSPNYTTICPDYQRFVADVVLAPTVYNGSI
jgi:hypothetical protein